VWKCKTFDQQLHFCAFCRVDLRLAFQGTRGHNLYRWLSQGICQ